MSINNIWKRTFNLTAKIILTSAVLFISYEVIRGANIVVELVK